jgi:translation initiation factor 4E
MASSITLMDTSPSNSNSTEYKLYDKWTLWAHLPHNTNWAFESYIKIFTFDNAHSAITLFETIPEEMVKNCMLFLMRDGIKPMWEDPKNKKGGCFSYKVVNKSVGAIWKNLSYSLVGESLTEEKNVRTQINGITISPKKHFCIIKIWLANCAYQNPAVISENLGITSQGCLFKTHMAS